MKYGRVLHVESHWNAYSWNTVGGRWRFVLASTPRVRRRQYWMNRTVADVSNEIAVPTDLTPFHPPPSTLRFVLIFTEYSHKHTRTILTFTPHWWNINTPAVWYKKFHKVWISTSFVLVCDRLWPKFRQFVSQYGHYRYIYLTCTGSGIHICPFSVDARMEIFWGKCIKKSFTISSLIQILIRVNKMDTIGEDVQHASWKKNAYKILLINHSVINGRIKLICILEIIFEGVDFISVKGG